MPETLELELEGEVGMGGEQDHEGSRRRRWESLFIFRTDRNTESSKPWQGGGGSGGDELGDGLEQEATTNSNCVTHGVHFELRFCKTGIHMPGDPG